MSTENKIETIEKEDVVDNLETKEDNKPKVDMDKLAALKEMAAKKRAAEEVPKEQVEEDDVPIKIVEERKRSLNFGVIGSGYAGSKLSEVWYSLGYPTVVMNTAPQDLEEILIPKNQCILLDAGFGGCAKDLDLSHEITGCFKGVIADSIQKHLGNSDVIILCTSLGGGSGGGSIDTLIDILSDLGKPVVVMGVLPKASEDALLKSNSIKTLSKLTKYFDDGKIDNIIIIDNAKAESVYSDINPFSFYSVVNKASVETIDIFNTMSRKKAQGVKILDSTEFAKLFIDGKGFTVYGQTRVENYEDEMAIATSIVESLKGNLLASGFDISQARYAGFMLVASESVWDKIPSSSLDFAQHMINDSCDSPLAVFQGIYKEKSNDDCVKIYSMFSGLGLPHERLSQLKTEAQQKMDVVARKDGERKLTMKIDVGETTVSQAEEIRRKIQQKSSSFGKLNNSFMQDRRKK